MLNLYTSFVIGVLGAWADGQTHSYDALYEARPTPGAMPLRVLGFPGRVEIEQDGRRASVDVDEVSRFGTSACVDARGTHASFAARVDDQWNLVVVDVTNERVALHALSAPPASRALMWREDECVAAALDALGTLHLVRGASHDQRDGVVAEVPDLGELARGLVLERVGETLIAGDDLGGLTLVRGEERVELALDDRAIWPITPRDDGSGAHVLSRQGTLYRIDLEEASITSELVTRAPTTTVLVVWRSRSADPRAACTA